MSYNIIYRIYTKADNRNLSNRRPAVLSKMLCGILIVIFSAGCKKFVDVGASKTSITQANVYKNDISAIQVLTGLYANLSATNNGAASLTNINLGTVFFVSGLSADEYMLYNRTNDQLYRLYSNSLSSAADNIYWQDLYSYIFITNAAIEGVSESTSLTPSIKQQLLGESKFFRAFCYFYLVNSFGDVPLALTTDPNVTSMLPRASKTDVYAQIESDLKDAKQLLSPNFLDGSLRNTTNERVRLTKWAAGALLARTYLYENKYNEAEAEADAVITSGRFSLLPDISQVFLKNSGETIWSLQPVYASSSDGYNTGEGKLFVLPSTGPNTGGSPSYPVYLSSYALNNFEPGDIRRTKWVDSVTAGGFTYFYPAKYKAGLSQTSVTEYSIVFRLAEQYLIRAEARARQNNISGAVSDLNAIRARSRATATASVPDPLPGLSTSLTQTQLYVAIEHERQSELFTEWAHRWFDLKRTPGFTNPSSTRADEVMLAVTAAKGGAWNPNWKLYPIPQGIINTSTNLKNAQNPGY